MTYDAQPQRMFIVKVFPTDSESSEHIFECSVDAIDFANDQTDYWQIYEDELLQCEGP
jgi:hypothetical protein